MGESQACLSLCKLFFVATISYPVLQTAQSTPGFPDIELLALFSVITVLVQLENFILCYIIMYLYQACHAEWQTGWLAGWRI